jgi:hypothetical protein
MKTMMLSGWTRAAVRLYSSTNHCAHIAWGHRNYQREDELAEEGLGLGVPSSGIRRDLDRRRDHLGEAAREREGSTDGDGVHAREIFGSRERRVKGKGRAAQQFEKVFNSPPPQIYLNRALSLQRAQFYSTPSTRVNLLFNKVLPPPPVFVT